MDLKKIEAIVGAIANPATGESLKTEGRLTQIEEKEGNLHIHYKRDGIIASHKKELEDKIYQVLESEIADDKIFLMSHSAEKSAAPKAAAPQQQASLQAGHGPAAAAKKRIEGVKKLIAVSSCKGGVGKSTVALNLAMSLKRMGKKVGLIDADIYGPSLPTLLGVSGAQPKASQTPGKKIAPVEVEGLKTISFGYFIGENDPVIWRGPMLGGVLNQFLFDVDWGELDFMILDLPPGTGDMQLSMVQTTEVDGAVIVSTPQKIALVDTKKGIKMFDQVKVPVLGLIENMSYFVPPESDQKYFIFGEGGGAQMAQELEIPFLGQIPLEIALRESCDHGIAYMNTPENEGRPVWNSYMEITEKLAKLEGETPKGFWGKLFKK